MIYSLFLANFVKSILLDYVCAFNSKVIVFAKFEHIFEKDIARERIFGINIATLRFYFFLVNYYTRICIPYRI